MGEAIMQAGVILALIELAKSPVEKIARLACAHREVAGAHIEKMQGMMRAVSDAAPKRSARLDHDEAERPIETREAGDGGGGAGESTADHAQSEWRLPHRILFEFHSSLQSLVRIKPPNKDLGMTHARNGIV
jgi:hypothetical protein